MGVIWFPSIHNFLKLKYSCASFTCKLRNNVMLFYKSNCKEREREWPTTEYDKRQILKNIFILAF